MIEHHYRPPEGFVDIPFIYVFDGRTQTPGASPENLLVRIQAEDFYLRSVVGMNTCAGTWRYYEASQSPAMSALQTATARYTVVPEKFYPALSGIKLDLGTVAIATNPSALDVGFIGFQGVKRVAEGQFAWANYKTDYQYYEKQFQYTLDLNLNFYADAGAGVQRNGVRINNYDFELQAIQIRRTDTDEVYGADTFLVNLYDPSGYNALSTAPMPMRWLNQFQPNNFFSLFPAPALVYPLNSRINLDITSLLNAAEGPRTYEIVFQGVERVQC